MPKVLITGINGFVGKHLTRQLKQMGAEVYGLSVEQTVHPEIAPLVQQYAACNLSEAKAVSELDLSIYDSIISLAGLANVGQSFAQPELYMQVNVAVLTNLCQKLINDGLAPRIVAISTGAVYDTAQALPLTEDSVLNQKGSPYVQSKIAMEKAALDFRRQGLEHCIVVVRPFNHVGPGQGLGFLVPDMYARIIETLTNGGNLKTGNLTTRRDYTDVRDVVRAYAQLALADATELSEPVYNVCSGQAHSGEQILAEFKKHISGLEKLEVVVDPGLIRPDDPPVLVGSSSRLSRDTNWHPEIAFEQTIADFVAAKQA